MNTRKRRKTSSTTAVTSPEATSSSTVFTTPESQIIATETEDQDLTVTNLEPQPSNVDEMCTPSSASLVVENYSASTSASFVVDPCSASSCTSGTSVVSTPLSTAHSCKDCTRRAKKKPQFTKSQQSTKRKSAEFKKRSVKPEAYHRRARKCEFQLSFFFLCHKQITLANYWPIFVLLPYMYCIIVVHLYLFTCLVALLIFSPSQGNIVMTCKYSLLFCYILAFIR